MELAWNPKSPVLVQNIFDSINSLKVRANHESLYHKPGVQKALQRRNIGSCVSPRQPFLWWWFAVSFGPLVCFWFMMKELMLICINDRLYLTNTVFALAWVIFHCSKNIWLLKWCIRWKLMFRVRSDSFPCNTRKECTISLLCKSATVPLVIMYREREGDK